MFTLKNEFTLIYPATDHDAADIPFQKIKTP